MSSGIRWSALGEYSTEGVIFVVYVILARLLAPRDFGLLAMAMVFVGMTDMFSRLGTNTIVIQQKRLTQGLLSSLFFLNLVAGIIVGGVFFLLSPLFGLLIDNPHVTPILRVLSITFVTSSIGSVHNGLLRRKLLFNRLAVIQLSAALSKGAVAIYLALAGYAVWALVIAILISDLLRTALLFFATAWLPRLHMDWREIKRVKSFMFNITGFGLFNSLSTRAGNFIIGRFLGATLLGYYSLAYRLQTLPNQYVSHVVGRVLLPSLSAAQDDDALFRRRYLRACAGVALITLPISVGLALVAEAFVLTVYGEKWRAAIPVIAILSLVGAIHSIAVLSGNIFIAKGQTGLWLKWGIFSGIISALSLLAGLPWGLVGVTCGCAVSTVALACLSFIISFRLFGLRLSGLFAVLRPYLLATAIMGLTVICLRGALDKLALPPAGILVCCACAGFLIYSICMFKIRPPAFKDFIDMLPGTAFSRLRVKLTSR